jgi:hypothetical protein
MPRTAWDFLNSPFISNIAGGFVQSIIGGLIIAFFVGLAITWVSGHWEEERARRQLQWDTFKEFNQAAADLIVRSADVYHLRGHVPEADYQRAYREMAHRKLTFLQADAELAGAFRDQSLFENFQRVKQHADDFSNAIKQQPEKAALPVLERAQNRFLWETKIMKMKMFREMGRLSEEEFKQGVTRLEGNLVGD